MGQTVQCVYLNKQAEGLDRAPWPGELGQRVLQNVSKEAWGEWMKHQTMLINENRLNPMDKAHRSYLADQMEKFLFGGEVDQPGAQMIHRPLVEIRRPGVTIAQLRALAVLIEQLGETALGRPHAIFVGIHVDEKTQNAIAIGGAVGTGIDVD